MAAAVGCVARVPCLCACGGAMGARKTSRICYCLEMETGLFLASVQLPSWPCRQDLILLGTMFMGGSQEQGAGEISVIPPSEMHSVFPRILSWSWLNNPITLDTRFRVSDISMLAVGHVQMFAKGVAEDLQLHHRLILGKTCSKDSS